MQVTDSRVCAPPPRQAATAVALRSARNGPSGREAQPQQQRIGQIKGCAENDENQGLTRRSIGERPTRVTQVNYKHFDAYGIRIAAATAPALMAVAGLQPDHLASPLPRPLNRFPIDSGGLVFVVPVPGIALLRQAVESGMRMTLVDAVIVRWRPGAEGRDLVTDVAIRSKQGANWHDNFRPWLCATTDDLWLIPESPHDDVWFRLSAKGVTGSSTPPFASDDDRAAGIDRAKSAVLAAITKVLDADTIGSPVSRGAI